MADPPLQAALDWALRALSFFNTVALLWLGFTILLTAERRTWGAWAAGSGLAVGGLVFAAHSALLARPLDASAAEIGLWWRLGWVALVGAPVLWSAVVAWYSRVLGRWPHRVGLAASAALGLAALALLAGADPRPGGDAAGAGRAPDLLLGLGLFVAYAGLCIALSLLAIRRPAAPGRFMGDLARRRARPWLVAAALVLLAVCFAAVAAALWLVSALRVAALPAFPPDALRALALFDLLVSGLIALAVVLAGRAIVAYEIFTGKTLPRGGLVRHWRTSQALAAGYAALLAASFLLAVEPIARLLLATALMTGFWALVSWRAYQERERSIERLRPFVASQRLYEGMLEPSPPPAADAQAPLRALCEEVLGARRAYLVPLGPLAALAGPPLAFPPAERAPAEQPAAPDLAACLRDQHALCVPLDPPRFGGAGWAVPLWSERGLIGALLLGDKRDGNVYTQEEIELARSTAERLLDTRASAEMARRLIALQRQRLAEGQVLDRRARRALHDDVLPRLHTALLVLSGARIGGTTAHPSRREALRGEAGVGLGPDVAEAVELLAAAHREIAGLLHELPVAVTADVARLGLVGALRQVAERDLGDDFDAVAWEVDPRAERFAAALPPLSAEALFCAAREAARNAARHGRAGDPRRPLHLRVAVRWNAGLEIAVEDDGVGPGAAGQVENGSGHGLALHGTTLAVIGGSLSLEGAPGRGTRVVLALPAAPTADTLDAAGSGDESAFP